VAVGLVLAQNLLCREVRTRHGSWSSGTDDGRQGRDTKCDNQSNDMSIVDLAKATLVCGALGFLIYRFPVLGQILILGFLGLLWLLYARRTLETLRRR
jgi:hypothetical protein